MSKSTVVGGWFGSGTGSGMRIGIGMSSASRGVAAIDSTIDSSIVSNLTTTIDFFNSKGTISIVDAIKHVEKTNVMTKIIFKI
jgi:hypothetical protein